MDTCKSPHSGCAAASLKRSPHVTSQPPPWARKSAPHIGVSALLVVMAFGLGVQLFWTTEHTLTLNISLDSVATGIGVKQRNAQNESRERLISGNAGTTGHTKKKTFSATNNLNGGLCTDPTSFAISCRIHAVASAPMDRAMKDPDSWWGSLKAGTSKVTVGKAMANSTMAVVDPSCKLRDVIRISGWGPRVGEYFESLPRHTILIGITRSWPVHMRNLTFVRWSSNRWHLPVTFLLRKAAAGLSQVGHRFRNGTIGINGTLFFGPTFPISLATSSYTQAVVKHPDMVAGNDWRPTDCKPRWKVAIIIPFRNREFHLWPFLDNMVTFLQTQKIAFTIFVIDQTGKVLFNRAALMNVGYLEAKKLGHYDCYVFHDVDMIPEDLANSYGCPDQPRHMSVTRSHLEYRFRYSHYFGGSISLKPDHIERINGFPNSYFAWGGEDDEIHSRVLMSGMKVRRYPIEIGRYFSLPHGRDSKNPHVTRHAVDAYQHGITSSFVDGLNTVNYTVTRAVFHDLYTHLYVHLPGPTTKGTAGLLHQGKKKRFKPFAKLLGFQFKEEKICGKGARFDRCDRFIL